MKKTTIRALLAGFSILLLVTLAYFSRSGLEGEAFAGVCACGHRRVTLKDGKIILAEPNHYNGVGCLSGVYSPTGTNVVLFVGGKRVPIATKWDHLGLRCVEPEPGRGHEYVVLKPRWKAYVYWICRMCRGAASR